MSCCAVLIDGSCPSEDSGGGGGGASTLQEAYDNSTSPEIVLSSAPGSLTIRDNAVPLVGNLLEIQSNNGLSTYFSVNNTGATINGKLTVSGLIDPTGLVLTNQVTVPGGTPAAGDSTYWARTSDKHPMFTNDTGVNQDLTPPNTILTTKGDLLGRNNTEAIRIPVGTNGQFLRVDNLADSGLSYASASSTLQEAYNNSTNPEIILSSVPGSLTIRDNATPLVGNLFEIQNNAGGTSYFSVDSTGATINGKLTVSGLIDPTGLVLTNQATVPGGMPTAGDSTYWARTSDKHPMFTNDTGVNQDLTPPNTILTTKGDLLGRNNTEAIRIPVGANGEFLRVDTSADSGLSYAAISTNIKTFKDSGGVPVATSNAVYTTIYTFNYNGSTSDGTISSAKIVANLTSAGTYSIRLQDITNLLTIASVTGQNNTAENVVDLGVISNIPLSSSILEIQGKVDTGIGSLIVNYASLELGISSATAQNLQDIYNQSTTGMITIDSIRGGFGVKDNATPIVGNLFEVQNNAESTTYFSVDNTGVTIDGKLTVSGLIDPTGLVLTNQVIIPGGTPAVGDSTIWVRTADKHLIFTNDTGTDQDIVAISDILTTKGDLLTYSTTETRLGVGANNTILKANSATSTGLEWGNLDGVLPTTTKGDLIAYNGTNNVRLPIGTNGYVLQPDSTLTNGLGWRILFTNIIRVDKSGNDTTGAKNGLPFLTVAAAMAVATSGDIVLVYPGNYIETSGITMTVGVSLAGVSKTKSIIQIFASANTDMITMTDASSLENISINLSSSDHYTLRGIVFTAGSNTNSRVVNVNVLVINVGASILGNSNLYGVYSNCSTTQGEDIVSIDSCVINVISTGTGDKIGILLDTAAGSIICRNSTFKATLSSGTGNYIGAQTNFAGTNLYLRNCVIQGTTSDFAQLLGTIHFNAVSGVTSNLNRTNNPSLNSVYINSGLGDGSSRPVIVSGNVPNYEIRGIASTNISDDAGFLRLRAGGGTTVSTASVIDLSGYSDIPDMNNNIVMYTNNTEVFRINNTGNILVRNSISTIPTNGDLTLACNGTGTVQVSNNLRSNELVAVNNTAIDNRFAVAIRAETIDINQQGLIAMLNSSDSQQWNMKLVNNAFTINGNITSNEFVINSGGNVSIGSATNNYKLHVNGTGNYLGRLLTGNSSGVVTPAANTNGTLFAYGSGTTDTSADIIHVREATNTNPREIYMGYNTTGGYGVIQSAYHGVSFTDTYLSPSGGGVRVGTTGILYNNSTASYSGNYLNYYEQAKTAVITFGGAIPNTDFTLTFSRIGNIVVCRLPNITGAVNVATFNISSSVAIPARYRPTTTTHRVLIAGLINNVPPTTPFSIDFRIDGIIDIYRDAQATSYTIGVGQSGSQAFHTCWMTA